jgi:hypothetical protein
MLPIRIPIIGAFAIGSPPIQRSKIVKLDALAVQDLRTKFEGLKPRVTELRRFL